MTTALQPPEPTPAGNASVDAWHELAQTLPLTLCGATPGAAGAEGANGADGSAYATDFGRTRTEPPAAVLRPRSVDDIRAALRFAQHRRLRVALRGAGHAASGLTLCQAGLIIDMRALCAVQAVDVAGRSIDVDGGASWEQVLAATLDAGLMPATTVDYQPLTVGGTLSTGGIGVQSFWAGVQADQVSELDIVSGTGELITCSRSREPAVFDRVRAGLGRAGAIVRARLPLIEAPAHVHLHELFYASAKELLADLQILTAARCFDTLLTIALPADPALLAGRLPAGTASTLCAQAAAGATPGWVYRLEAGQYGGGVYSARPIPPLHHIPGGRSERILSIREFLFRTPPLMQRPELYAPAHPELILFIPESSAEALLTRSLCAAPPAELGGGPVLLLGVHFAAVSAPQLRVPTQARGFMFSLLRVAAPDTASRVRALTTVNQQLYAEALAAGAIRYPCDALPFPAFDRPRWEALRPLCARLDPAGVLSGCEREPL